MSEYVIEMNHIRKEFPGIVANDDITLQLKKGEIHALLGENGAGKSTLMSVLFGLYQPEAGEIKKDGKVVEIHDPNDATALGIGMVHQHFKLVDVFTVLDNIILGAETTDKLGFLKKKEAIFIGALLVISVVLCIFVYAVPHGTHGSIQITVDGELYGTYSLAEDQVIQIGDTNVCEIKDGEVKMTEADCPDHLCMKQPAVGSAGGYIVCLPNRVVIQGEGNSDSQDSESGFDAVV